MAARTISLRYRRSGATSRVVVQAGGLDRLGVYLREFRGRRAALVSEPRVAALYAARSLASLKRGGIDATLVCVPTGERAKSSRHLSRLWDEFARLGLGRADLVIALGGGAVGDLAGFAAATWLRGIEWACVPTSLLAQVDSSVGGKVGINHRLGKNLIGAFHHPSAVYIDPRVLSTLSSREFRNGLAEMIKIAAALDRGLFRDLERNGRKISKDSELVLAQRIARAIGLKAAVVAKDEQEAGLRKVLNLGHTIGHAVEAASGFRIHHGEAVAIGLAAEAEIAVEMDLLPRKEHARLLRVLRNAGLPTRIPRDLGRRRFLRALSADKKSERGAPRFVLLHRIGHSVVGVEVPTPFLIERIGGSR